MTNDMTKGAITPLLIRFTIPLVLGNLFQLTYNAADSLIVGKFVGEEALAAVGTSNPLMTLAILFINGMCLGAGILVSTAFGAGNTQLMEHQVSTTAIAGTVFSLAFSALCVILATPLLQLMQVPADILPIAVSYLRIVFAGLIFTFFYNFLAATPSGCSLPKPSPVNLLRKRVRRHFGAVFPDFASAGTCHPNVKTAHDVMLRFTSPLRSSAGAIAETGNAGHSRFFVARLFPTSGGLPLPSHRERPQAGIR